MQLHVSYPKYSCLNFNERFHEATVGSRIVVFLSPAHLYALKYIRKKKVRVWVFPVLAALGASYLLAGARVETQSWNSRWINDQYTLSELLKNCLLPMFYINTGTGFAFWTTGDLCGHLRLPETVPKRTRAETAVKQQDRGGQFRLVRSHRNDTRPVTD